MVGEEFKRLKENAAENLKRLQRAAAFSVSVEKGSHYRTRVLDCLHLVTDGDIVRDCMNEVAGAELCGSVFCDRCRERRQSSIFCTFKDYTAEEFGDDEDAARERLRFVSVLHSLVAVQDGGNMIAAFVSVEEVKAAVSDMKNVLTLVKKKAQRRHNADIWLRGGVHIELIDFDMFALASRLGRGTVKTDTINSFIRKYAAEKKFSTQSGKFFLVHFHALADKKDLSDQEFKRLFKERWSLTEKQVHIQRTWTKIRFKKSETVQSLDDGLIGMARYCFNGSNGRLTYAQNWGAGSVVFKTGESVDAKGHIVGFAEEVMGRDADERLSVGDVALLVEAHNQVNGDSHKGLLVAIY